MRKVVLYLFAALLVVALPLSAMAGTQIFKAKDMDVDYWEFCPQYGYYGVGPAQEFGVDIYIHYVGTEKFNARVKNGDVGWNRNVHGTATIYDAGSVGGGENMMSAMSALPKMNFTTATGTIKSMYPLSACMSAIDRDFVIPNVSSIAPLYSGPFQIEEVLQDDGGDFGCFNPAAPAAVNFQDCYGTGYWQDLTKVDYLMLHIKITGNKIYFWKATIHEPGVLQLEDKRGFNKTWTYPLQ